MVVVGVHLLHGECLTLDCGDAELGLSPLDLISRWELCSALGPFWWRMIGLVVLIANLVSVGWKPSSTSHDVDVEGT